MRIMINAAFLAGESLGGGGWTHATQLIHYLTRRRGPDEVIVIANAHTARQIPVSEVAGRRIVADVDPRSPAGRVAWENVVLPRLVRHHRPDVFHSSGNTLPFGIECPTVLTIHDLQYLHYPMYFPLFRRVYLGRMVPSSLKRATRVMCDSEYTRKDVLENFTVDENKLDIVYLSGLLDGETRGNGVTQAAPERTDIGPRYLLSVGSSLPHKNLARMIEAFSLVAPEIPHELVIIGEGFSRRQHLLDVLAKLPEGIRGRVRMLGFLPREELLEMYRGADAFVFPSLFEGFGIPPLEAMGCGCPVIASRGTSVTEVVGNAAVLFDPTNTEDMASAIRAVCLESSLRDQLRARGRTRADEFSWERMTEETLRVYREAVGSK